MQRKRLIYQRCCCLLQCILNMVAGCLGSGDLNITKLNTMYASVLGTGDICFPSDELRALPYTPAYTSCTCDPECVFGHPPCCYDAFFKRKDVHCRNLSLTMFHPNRPSVFYVIDTCPLTAEPGLVAGCARDINNIDKMAHPPVIDPVTKTSYLNKNCAQCNGVLQTEDWELEMTCTDPTDFNYLSSHEDILSKAQLSGCSIVFQTQHAFMCAVEQNVVKKCNVSGTWQNYDRDIEMACLSDYGLKYDNFKNIFCAMCNPPVTLPDADPLSCVNPFDADLTAACTNQPVNLLRYPYRNIYCRICDQYRYDVPTGTPQMFSSTFKANAPKPFQYILKYTFGQTHISNIIDKARQERRKTSWKNRQFHSSTVNITNLMEKSFSAFAGKTCNSSHFGLTSQNLFLQDCSCHLGCTKTCCDDLAIQQPFSCINTAFPPSEIEDGGYYVLNDCPSTDETIRSLCTTTDKYDITFNIPVTIGLEGHSASFRNIYCLLGNIITSSYEDLNLYSVLSFQTLPWTVIIACPYPISVSLWLLPEFVLQYSLAVNCTHALHPAKKVAVCDTKDVDIKKCNQTGTWALPDSDVSKACENTEHFRFPTVIDKVQGISYKNKFCKLCNPYNISKIQAPISTCPSNLWNTSYRLYEDCRNLPDTHACSEYKNVACEACNGVKGCDLEYSKELMTNGTGGHVMMLSYRSMLALSAFGSKHQPQTYCSQQEVLDQASCRKLECFPGRILDGSSCVPVLRSTDHLRFAINIQIIVTLEEPMFVSMVLKTVQLWVQASVMNITQSGINFERSIFVSNHACNAQVSNLKISSDVAFYIGTRLSDRTSVEKQLVNITRSVSQMILFGTRAVIQTHLNFDLQFLNLDANSVQGICRIVEKSSAPVPSAYRRVLINQLLICQLIILKSEEFVADSPSRIRILASNKTLSFQEFRVSDNGSYQICVDNFVSGSVENSFLSNVFSPLSILTGSCTVVSVICLFVTFLTYCAFESLRTIPGINSMCLTAALFCLQLFMLTRKYFLKSHFVLRVFLSATTHYFLLSVFFWLNICSYHMYSVFTDKFKVHHELRQLKTSLVYSMYFFGMPFLIVLGNIVVFLIITSGQQCGYGETDILVDNKISYFVTFIAPLSFVCIVNSICFAVTTYKIKSTSMIDDINNGQVHFVVYLKLSTLTGLTWAFQILDSFLELTFLSYVVAVLNSLQGFFLFISYVCNARVWKMYKDLMFFAKK